MPANQIWNKAIYGCAIQNDENIHADRRAGTLNEFKIRVSMAFYQCFYFRTECFFVEYVPEQNRQGKSTYKNRPPESTARYLNQCRLQNRSIRRYWTRRWPSNTLRGSDYVTVTEVHGTRTCGNKRCPSGHKGTISPIMKAYI